MNVPTLEALTEQINVVQARRAALIEARRPIDVEIASTYDDLTLLQGHRDSILVAQPRTREEDIKFFLACAADESAIMYRARNDFWYKNGLTMYSTSSTLGQVVLRLAMTKGDSDNYIDTLTTLNDVLPHYYAGEDGCKRISIFEHSLSSHGNFTLKISPDGTCAVVKRYYHSESVVATFKDLDNALVFIQDNLYYEDSSTAE